MTVCDIYHSNTITQIIPLSGKLSPFVDLLYFQYYKSGAGWGGFIDQAVFLFTLSDIDQTVCKIQPWSGRGPS